MVAPAKVAKIGQGPLTHTIGVNCTRREAAAIRFLGRRGESLSAVLRQAIDIKVLERIVRRAEAEQARIARNQ